MKIESLQRHLVALGAALRPSNANVNAAFALGRALNGAVEGSNAPFAGLNGAPGGGAGLSDDGAVLDEEGREVSRLGARRAVLNGLSPATTFIAYNYNTPVDVEDFEREANRILEEAECGWMYLTLHKPNEDRMRRPGCAAR